MTFLPYGRQTMEADDVAAVVEALSGDFLTTGPTVGRFEAAFATVVGAAQGVASNSGTAALHLPLMALDVGPGDVVIVPSITFLSTANVVRMVGAEVAFADVDQVTGLLTVASAADALQRARQQGGRVVGAMPVHLNGQLCDLAALGAWAEAEGLWLVEDACHALGAPGVGAVPASRAAAFSTHAVKGVTTAEGGVTTTQDAALAERMRSLRSHGMTRQPEAFRNVDLAFSDGVANPWYYEMPEVGWNYRLPDVLCALGISQLAKFDRFIARRRALAARYEELLAPLQPVIRPVPRILARDGLHLLAVLIDFDALGMDRRRLMEALRAEGIGTQVHYIPVHTQPYYRARYGDLHLPGADAYYRACLSLPLFPMMQDSDVDRVASTLTRLCSKGS